MLLPLCAYRCAKRTLDIALSAMALLVLLPLFIPLIAPCKGRLEVWYVQHRSFWLDLKLIFVTVWVIVFPKSAFYQRWLESPNQMLKS
jgi:lipopolysaccharide/colanic/teichoic acid biosynthesis glycosyltransferase